MINVILIILLIGIIAWGVYNEVESSVATADTPVQAKVVATPPQPAPLQSAIDELTPEQHQFMRQVFLPRWEVMRKTYPIPVLRTRFDRLAARILSNDIRLQVSALYKEGRPGVLGEADRNGLQCVIRFFQPALKDLFTRIPEEETRDDVILGMMLHEEYHLNYHVFVPILGPNTAVENSLRESDTWWWCCETIYAPMFRHGRLRNLPPDDAIHGAMQCFTEANGDKTSPAWMRFILADPMLKAR